MDRQSYRKLMREKEMKRFLVLSCSEGELITSFEDMEPKFFDTMDECNEHINSLHAWGHGDSYEIVDLEQEKVVDTIEYSEYVVAHTV